MKAINNYLIIEKEKIGPKKVGGLILTEDLDKDNRYIRGKVISVGNNISYIKKDDMLYYDKHAGHSISLNDALYQVIRDKDVVIVE
tara:strand:+ start:1974 stop:2231 length:258 start_codon:yes stop_codon:yes gene_type:complete